MGTAAIITPVYLAVHVKDMVSAAAELVEEILPPEPWQIAAPQMRQESSLPGYSRKRMVEIVWVKSNAFRMKQWGWEGREGHLYHQLCHQEWICPRHPAGSHGLELAGDAAPPTSARDNVLVARVATCHHPTGSGRVVAKPQGGQQAVTTHRTVVRRTPAHLPKCSAG